MRNGKIKVCFAITSITNNGVTRVVSILLDYIDYELYDVYVLLTRKRSHLFELNPNAKVIEVKSDIKDGKLGRLKNLCELREIIVSNRFDVIVALGDYAAMYVCLACFGINQTLIVSERNNPNREPDKFILRKLRDVLYHTVDSIVCQTKDAAEYYKNIVKNRIVIHNPIKEDLPLWDGERDKKIVNFCRIDSQKNLFLLVNAFERFHQKHSDYELDIYGNGPKKQELLELIKTKKLDTCVHLYDFCLDIHEKIKKSMMFVSTSDFEGMSNSMLEAMAMGIPSICTDCPIGGAKEIIKNGENGILVPVGDEESVLRGMCFYAENHVDAKRIGKNAEKIRLRLSNEKICNQWWQVIDSVARSRING